ncbi:MAG: hypothetical protein SPI12_03555 [Actinomycetaceae bacterium]|nr:hypothetical protein [Actinomycetaceae bacterium]MDY6082923.1 hypothetical protein [Actinomycetaceae bacterium]
MMKNDAQSGDETFDGYTEEEILNFDFSELFAPAGIDEEDLAEEWENVIAELADQPAAQRIARTLADAQLPLPDVHQPIANATAILAWSEQRIALVDGWNASAIVELYGFSSVDVNDPAAAQALIWHFQARDDSPTRYNR